MKNGVLVKSSPYSFPSLPKKKKKKHFIKFNPMLTILSFPQSHLSNLCFITRFFFFFHLRADLWRQQEIIWKGNKTLNFRLTEALLADSRTIFSGGAGMFSILFHQQTKHNFLSLFFLFPVVCFRQWAPSYMDELGQNTSQLPGCWPLYHLPWLSWGQTWSMLGQTLIFLLPQFPHL